MSESNLRSMFPIEKSDLYQFHLREEAEIEKCKWLLSEEIGKDCGMQYARWIWHWKYRAGWIAALKASGDKCY